jgi:ornithine cyclodeaminase/alanine dehydrogenase-like protein (mu-crystallin family)
MPSQYDNTYHWEYSKPSYDSVEEEAKFKAIHEADLVFEVTPSREPTREEQLQYLNW